MVAPENTAKWAKTAEIPQFSRPRYPRGGREERRFEISNRM